MNTRHIGTTRLTAGDILDGRYEVIDVLGQGGMGETFKARDRSNGQIVVVKIPYANVIGDPSTYSRFQRELEIGKRLDHPGTQRFLAEGRLDGVAPYVVFEFIDGENFRQYLTRHAPLEISKAIDFAAQLADVLGYVHNHGIVHRDLKPENLLITSEGRLKLVDFGIALLRGARRLTFGHLSNEVGTPDYMAPEQVQGERGDARTDVYALGVILYEMLTGQVPFQGDSPLAVMGQRVRSPAPLVRSARRDVPPALEAIVFKALQRSPEERYPSMAALRDDLLHLDQVAIPAYTSEVRARRGVPRPILWTAFAVVVLIGLLVIGVLAEALHRAQVGSPG